MNNLTYSQTKQGLEVVILNSGEAFCTQSSYSRWIGMDRTTIVKRCSNLETLEISDLQADVKIFTRDQLIKTQIDTGNQLHTVVLIPAKIMGRWLAKDNPEFFDEMVDAGATQFLYTLAGYQIKAVQITEQTPAFVLPPADIRVTNLVNSLQSLDFDLTNPRFNQGLKDFVGDILGLTPNKTLEPSQEIWLGVAERAEQLGYSIDLVVKNRIGLGKFVKASGLLPKKEKRLCGGTQREINLYLLTDELDNYIREFMDAKALANSLKNKTK